jgi:ribonuclease HII
MKRAVESLQQVPDMIQVDGLHCPRVSMPAEAIVQGDSKVQAIAAASILAKTARDAEMMQLHEIYPQYDFARHKGYPTTYHMECLILHGVSPVHRRSYAPIRKLLALDGRSLGQ